MPPTEWMDTYGPRHTVLQTWAHAVMSPVGALQTETMRDRTSVFFPMWTRLWKIAEIIAQWATSSRRNKHSTVFLTDDLRKAHPPTKMGIQLSLWRTASAYPYWNSSFSWIFLEEIIYCSISLIAYLAKNLWKHSRKPSLPYFLANARLWLCQHATVLVRTCIFRACSVCMDTVVPHPCNGTMHCLQMFASQEWLSWGHCQQQRFCCRFQTWYFL